MYITARLIKEFDSKCSSHYLDQAVSMLLAYNGKFRFMGAGGLISETYQDRIDVIESRRERLMAAVILTLVVIVLAGVALYVIKRKNKRLGIVKMQFEEKDRRHPGKDNILTNEIRIFALMRLGVKESDRIVLLGLFGQHIQDACKKTSLLCQMTNLRSV